MVEPRVRWVPPGRRSKLGQQAVELAAECGLELDEWQQLVVESAFRRRGDRWAAFEVGVNVARQNGKGAILEALMLAWSIICRDRYVIYSAHMYDTSMEHFRRLRYLIEDNLRLSGELAATSRASGIKHAHGEEGIEFKGDRRMRFRTRSRGGGRGFSADKIVWDEAMFAPEFTHGAMLPSVSARPDAQVIYAGSAVDQQIHEHGLVFARIRERGLKGDDPTLAYFEWSVEGDNPDRVPEAVLEDQAAWAQANPALGIRIRPEAVDAEFRSMSPRTFAVERLGVGDWPRTDFLSEQIIAMSEWNELYSADSVLVDPVCLAFDVSPERRGSIAAAGASTVGGFHVEIVEDRGGTAWLPQRIVELNRTHSPRAIVCDDRGPAASLIPILQDLGVTVKTYNANEHAAACGRLVDIIREQTAAPFGFRRDPGIVANREDTTVG